jgi:hypothetical protein
MKEHWISSNDLLAFLDITPIGKESLLNARKLNFPDYEDAIVAVAAKESNSEFIITNNVKHFTMSEVKAITSKSFLQFIEL